MTSPPSPTTSPLPASGWRRRWTPPGESARALTKQPGLADLLGQRHRIIANDWHSAALQTLISRLVRRALDILEEVDFTPHTVREDLAGPRLNPGYLYSAAELIDRAADLAADSAELVHDNEARWRAFRARVRTLVEEREEDPR